VCQRTYRRRNDGYPPAFVGSVTKEAFTRPKASSLSIRLRCSSEQSLRQVHGNDVTTLASGEGTSVDPMIGKANRAVGTPICLALDSTTATLKSS
jgi:hypothetical protein